LDIKVVRKIDVVAPLTALTFDDGPHPVFTPRALEILAKHGVNATFFFPGSRVERLGELVKQVQDAGHEIGAHGYSHKNLVSLGYGGAYQELSKAQEALKVATGRTSPYLRPPYGAYNQMVLKAAGECGFQYSVMWNVDPRDYASAPGAILQSVSKDVAPGNIILFHEVTPSTTAALDLVIKGITDRGLRLGTITELFDSVGKSELAGEPTPFRELRLRTPLMRGSDVETVQMALNGRGYDPGKLDGMYGQQTSMAVKHFQLDFDLEPTGSVTREVCGRLGVAIRKA
jgi:peptidoglycan/xylan/chitin deacetylase (PgdA/CDA1 family)